MKRTITFTIIILLAFSLLASCENKNELAIHLLEESSEADARAADTYGFFNEYTTKTDLSWNPDGKEMTLDDVRELSAKGDDLLIEDFRQYRTTGNASSNLDRYILVYTVEGGYRLIVNVALEASVCSLLENAA